MHEPVCRSSYTAHVLVCADESYSSPVKKMLGPVPEAVRQAAIQGHAAVLRQSGKAPEAAALLQSLIEQQDESQLQHALCADYGSVLREQSNLQVVIP